MSEGQKLFIRIDKTKERPFFGSFGVSRTLEGIRRDDSSNNSAPDLETDPTSDSKTAKTSDPAPDSFDTITKDFTALIRKFNKTINTVMQLMPVALQYEIDVKLRKYCELNGVVVEKSELTTIFEVGASHHNEFHKFLIGFKSLTEGVFVLPELFILGLVSAYDAFLATLIKVIFKVKPELISASERTLTYAELAGIGSILDAQNFIIEKEVESVLRQSHSEHFSWLEKKLGMPLTKDLPIWPRFIELCERRNLLTHAGGVVSSQYLAICKNNNIDTGKLKVGDRVDIDGAYIRQAIDVIEEIGIKLIQVIWRKLLPGDIESASTSLSGVGYDLITQRRYKMANVLLEFGLALKKHGSDKVRRMMIINLANAHKLDGEPEEGRKILANHDWTAASDDFQICIAAIKDDVDGVCKLLPTVGTAGSVTEDNFREWPVFESMRKSERFATAFERHFGKPLLVTEVGIGALKEKDAPIFNSNSEPESKGAPADTEASAPANPIADSG